MVVQENCIRVTPFGPSETLDLAFGILGCGMAAAAEARGGFR